MIERVLLRAHQVRSIGAGQRYLVERTFRSNGRIYQRINEGTPEPTRNWKMVGRWSDLDAERAKLTAEGWRVEE